MIVCSPLYREIGRRRLSSVKSRGLVVELIKVSCHIPIDDERTMKIVARVGLRRGAFIRIGIFVKYTYY